MSGSVRSKEPQAKERVVEVAWRDWTEWAASHHTPYARPMIN